jgi:hypothetical protein
MSPRRGLSAAATATILLAAGVALMVALSGQGGSSTPPAAVPASLPGELTGPAPWPRNEEKLRARLAALRLPALSREGSALHIHAHLDVFVLGRRVVVPAGIGIGGSFISPLHTHDATGVIHVESPTVRSFTLGEFLGVWGIRLRHGCLGGYCTGGGKTLRVYVDGRSVAGPPGRLVLEPQAEIVVAYGSLRQVPRPIPDRYAFPAGL